jgi:hypothetical protein
VQCLRSGACPSRRLASIRPRPRRSPARRFSARHVAASIPTEVRAVLRDDRRRAPRRASRSVERFLEAELADRSGQRRPPSVTEFDDETAHPAARRGDGSRVAPPPGRAPREIRSRRPRRALVGSCVTRPRSRSRIRRGVRGRGGAHPRRRRSPTPRPNCRSPSSRAARWSTRRVPIASGCSSELTRRRELGPSADRPVGPRPGPAAAGVRAGEVSWRWTSSPSWNRSWSPRSTSTCRRRPAPCR